MEEATEIKPGYKKTKMGWIPNEWDVFEITSLISDYSSGANIKSSEFVDDDYAEQTIEILPKSGLRYGGSIVVKDSKKQLVPYQLAVKSYQKSWICDGEYATVLRDLVPAGPNIGLIAQLKGQGPLLMAQGVYSLNWNEMTYGVYMSNVSNCDWYRTIMRRTLVGSTQVHIGVSDFFKIKIPLPPLPEQKKIADILSTWDKAIETTQVLIDKLQLRKKGLMQQLLTGKKRLPGFEGEWEFIKASEIFANHTNKDHDGEFEVLSATQDKGVIPRSQTGIDIKYNKSSLKNYKKIEVGDFIISLRSFQGGIEYSNYTGLVSPAYTVLREKTEIAKEFYKAYLKTETFISRLNSIIYGIRDGKQISYRDFSCLKLHYPEVKEQTVIAQVLIKADEEIDQTQNYLDRLQEQKKGLMQQLLTGQKRVQI